MPAPKFAVGDRVKQVGTGKSFGHCGIVVEVVTGVGRRGSTDYLVTWNGMLGHVTYKESELELATIQKTKRPATKQSAQPPAQTKLDLLIDAEPATGLEGLATLARAIREMNTLTSQLAALHRTVKTTILYQDADLTLFMTMKGESVVLVKEVDGVQESVSIPTSVFAILVDPLLK